MTPQNNQARWQAYMDERTGTYEFRRHRFGIVADRLSAMGLNDSHLLVDVGAGSTEFDYFLRTERNWRGKYLPVDGALDGTDLESWRPETTADFYVLQEVVEHLYSGADLLKYLPGMATRGVVVTTPNPGVVDVLALDRTHVTEFWLSDFSELGYEATATRLFGKPNDSIVAWTAGTWGHGFPSPYDPPLVGLHA